MSGPTDAPVAIEGPELHIVSRQFRLYVGLSRSGEYLHVVSPAVQLLDQDGNVVRPDGALACTCKGGTYHGSCYRLRQAEALERGEADVDVWVHPETELEMAAARG